MSLIQLVTNPAPVAPTPAPSDPDHELLEQLAEELGCHPDPVEVASRIIELVTFEEVVQDALEIERDDPRGGVDEVGDRIEELREEAARAGALDALQNALGLTDRDLLHIASAASPEWTARSLIAGAVPPAAPLSPLRVMVQTTIRGLQSRSAS